MTETDTRPETAEVRPAAHEVPVVRKPKLDHTLAYIIALVEKNPHG